jgi:hypothetical protein
LRLTAQEVDVGAEPEYPDSQRRFARLVAARIGDADIAPFGSSPMPA